MTRDFKDTFTLIFKMEMKMAICGVNSGRSKSVEKIS